MGAGQRLSGPNFATRISARLAKRIDDARASYWFVPTMLVLWAIVAAQLTLLADSHADILPEIIDRLSLITSEDGARAVVSVIAQSVLGVAGVLFSITMLAVSFASGQFGPRLIGNFMRDRGNQWSLGLLIATFTFSLLILRAIANPAAGNEAFVPHFSVVVAMGMALTCVFVVIYHVHHVPETISVSNIVADLGRRFAAEIARMVDCDPNGVLPGSGQYCDVPMLRSGYVHNIAEKQLSTICEAQGWTVEVLAEPGEFVHPQRATLRVWGTATLEMEVHDELRQTVAVGDAKTEHQNVIFIAEQLVEIVARAMSPGVNDPFTAIAGMQWLGAGLAGVAGREQALSVFTAPHIIAPGASFSRLLDATLGDCVPYTAQDPLTRRTLLGLLDGLAEKAAPGNKKALEALAAQIRAVADAPA